MYSANKSQFKSVLGCLMHGVIPESWTLGCVFYKKQSGKAGGRRPLAGFTLIELLVVVLIIGILAAVALPQYQKAVLKSRMAEVLVYLHAYEQGEELYYMANGTYTDYPANLDVSMPFPPGAVSNEDKGYFFVPEKGIFLDVIGTVGVPSLHYVQGGLGHMPPGGTSYLDFVRDITYTVYLKNSTKPGEKSCFGRTKEFQDLCKTLEY